MSAEWRLISCSPDDAQELTDVVHSDARLLGCDALEHDAVSAGCGACGMPPPKLHGGAGKSTGRRRGTAARERLPSPRPWRSGSSSCPCGSELAIRHSLPQSAHGVASGGVLFASPHGVRSSPPIGRSTLPSSICPPPNMAGSADSAGSAHTRAGAPLPSGYAPPASAAVLTGGVRRAISFLRSQVRSGDARDDMSDIRLCRGPGTLQLHDRGDARLGAAARTAPEHQGADALTDAELLAILLRSGLRGRSVLDLSRDILQAYDGDLRPTLPGIGQRSCAASAAIGTAKAVEIRAAFALAGRLRQLTALQRPVLDSPQSIARMFRERFRSSAAGGTARAAARYPEPPGRATSWSPRAWWTAARCIRGRCSAGPSARAVRVWRWCTTTQAGIPPPSAADNRLHQAAHGRRKGGRHSNWSTTWSLGGGGGLEGREYVSPPRRGPHERRVGTAPRAQAGIGRGADELDLPSSRLFS